MARAKNPGAKLKYTVEQICQALDSTRGMIYMSADRLKCSPQTIYNYADRYPKIQECLAAHRGRRVDRAEYGLDEKVAEGDLGAIKYVLSCLGRDRGYGEKSEHEHKHTFGAIEVPGVLDEDEWDAMVARRKKDDSDSGIPTD